MIISILRVYIIIFAILSFKGNKLKSKPDYLIVIFRLPRRFATRNDVEGGTRNDVEGGTRNDVEGSYGQWHGGSDAELFLHAAEQVKGLERGHVVEVRPFEVFLEG